MTNEVTFVNTWREISGASASGVISRPPGAHAKGRKIAICGEAPSNYPDFAQFLVEQKIDSISLTPDTVLKTTLAILDKE